jgi:hypothetical protein
MSRLEDISEQYRKREEARNSYNKNDEFGVGHPNALSDGDEKGKGENAGQVGSKTDIEQRKLAAAKNKYNLNRPYDDSTA